MKNAGGEFRGHINVMSSFTPGAVDKPNTLVEEAVKKDLQLLAITDSVTEVWPKIDEAARSSGVEVIFGWNGRIYQNFDGMRYPITVLAETNHGLPEIRALEKQKRLSVGDLVSTKEVLLIVPLLTVPLLRGKIDSSRMYVPITIYSDRESREAAYRDSETAKKMGLKTVASMPVWQAFPRPNNVLHSSINRASGTRMELPNNITLNQMSDNNFAYNLLSRIYRDRGFAPSEYPFHPEGYLKHPLIMGKIYSQFPESTYSTWEISERCQIKELPKTSIPDYPAPGELTPDKYLRILAENGMRSKFKKVTPEMRSRLELELKRFEEKNLTSHILIVWDMIKSISEKGIENSDIGSGEGSLVCYCLGITKVNPLGNNLMFNRFVSEVTQVVADIDILVAEHGLVSEIVSRRSAELGFRAFRIAEFQNQKTRSSLRKVLQFFNFSNEQIREIIQNFSHKKPIDETAVRLITLAKDMASRERPFRVVTHPTKFIFLTLNEYENGALKFVNRRGEIVCVIDKDSAKDKSNLDTVSSSMMEILGRLKKQLPGVVPDLKDPLPIRKLFKSGNIGVPMVETEFLSQILREMSEAIGPDVTKFDLVVALAISRPGVWYTRQSYYDKRSGAIKTEYKHPELKRILGETYGQIIFQEQALEIAKVFGGFDDNELEVLRKMMSKNRDQKLIMGYFGKFKDNSMKKGLNEKDSLDMFEQILHFAYYGFLKGHSISLAMTIAKLAWYKQFYPVEFMEIVKDLGRGFYHHTGQAEKYTNELQHCLNKRQ